MVLSVLGRRILVKRMAIHMFPISESDHRPWKLSLTYSFNWFVLLKYQKIIGETVNTITSLFHICDRRDPPGTPETTKILKTIPEVH